MQQNRLPGLKNELKAAVMRCFIWSVFSYIDWIRNTKLDITINLHSIYNAQKMTEQILIF